MFTAAAKALSEMFTQPLRAVLFKAIGLALRPHRPDRHRAATPVLLDGDERRQLGRTDDRRRAARRMERLVWVLSIMASLGIITGALFLMPAVTAFVGSFFVDEIAEHVERADYPAEVVGKALPLTRALYEGIKVALLALIVYVCALPFVFFAGIGFLVLFLANAYLLSREYFELAAMRFRSPEEAKAMRKRNAGYLFFAGFMIAAFVSIPIVNLATPIFAMAMMVHIHKTLSGPRPELIEPKKA